MRGDHDTCKTCGHYRVHHFEPEDFDRTPDPDEIGCIIEGCDCKEYVLGQIEGQKGA